MQRQRRALLVVRLQPVLRLHGEGERRRGEIDEPDLAAPPLPSEAKSRLETKAEKWASLACTRTACFG